MAIEIQAKNPTIQMGIQGPRGERGPKGDPFTYDDFTPEQLEQLKGPKGDPFTYNDFTPEQLESLKGPKGDKGDAFTYDDFTAEQLEQLKGPKGDPGPTYTAGENITISADNVISATGGGGGGSYTLPTASTTTLGGVKVDGTSITIDDNGVISSTGGGSATVYRFSSNDTLTQEQKNQLIDCAKNREKIAFINGELVISADIEYQDINKKIPYHIHFVTITNMDNIHDIQGNYDYGRTSRYNYYDAYVFPSGSGSIREIDTLDTGIEEVKHISWPIQQKEVRKGKYDWMIAWVKGKKYQVWINNFLVYQISQFSNYLRLYLIGYDSGSGGYSVGSTYIYFTDDTFTKLDTTMSYSNFATDTLLTSYNWNQYITVSGGGSWSYTTDTTNSDLYNAREVVIIWTDTNSNYHHTYLNVGYDDYGNSSNWGFSWSNRQISLDSIDSSYNGSSITYDGSSVNTSDCSINAICYKT